MRQDVGIEVVFITCFGWFFAVFHLCLRFWLRWCWWWWWWCFGCLGERWKCVKVAAAPIPCSVSIFRERVTSGSVLLPVEFSLEPSPRNILCTPTLFHGLKIHFVRSRTVQTVITRAIRPWMSWPAIHNITYIFAAPLLYGSHKRKQVNSAGRCWQRQYRCCVFIIQNNTFHDTERTPIVFFYVTRTILQNAKVKHALSSSSPAALKFSIATYFDDE